MSMNNELLGIPGYVSIREAAQILGLSESRMYGYVREQRLPIHRVGNTILIEVKDLEQFKFNPPGRSRTKTPDWRVYNARSQLLVIAIDVQIRAGQQEHLAEKLQAIRSEKRHTLTGTMARYVLRDRAAPDTLSIWLVWKDTEMPSEEQRQRELAAFQDELADVVDWQTAQYSEKEGLIYT